MQQNYAALKAAGAELIAISSDSVQATQQLVQARAFEFLLLADPQLSAIADYNVVDPSNNRIARPAVYILHQDGTVAWRSLNTVQNRVPTAQILTELGKL